MDLPLAGLRALEAVARHGSFSRAAEELRLTQPAVSMQVRQIESRVGLPLLERVGKRAFPTKAGDVLLAHAGRAFRELETGVALVQELRGVVAGRVRLGTSASVSIYLLPPLLRRFRARYPETELTVVTGNATEITRAIVHNELDVGVVSLPVKERELNVTPFYKDELVAIAPPGFARGRGGRGVPRRRVVTSRRTRRSAWLPSIAAAELGREALILYERGSTVRRLVDDWFRREHVSPGLPMELGNTEAIKKLVEAGLGLSIASWFSVKTEVDDGLLRALHLEPPLVRQIGVVRRKDKPKTPPLEAFFAALEELRRMLDTGRGRTA